eukprot:3429932-Amphidinium_carterae.1
MSIVLSAAQGGKSLNCLACAVVSTSETVQEVPGLMPNPGRPVFTTFLCKFDSNQRRKNMNHKHSCYQTKDELVE